MSEQELIDAARKSLEDRDGGGWGYRVQLEVDETFGGRYRGDEVQTGGDYGDSTVYLFWDGDGNDCYMRGHAALVRKMQTVDPNVGDDVAVVRGPDYTTANGTGYAYGVAKRANDKPLPNEPVQTTLDGDDDW